VPPSDPPLGREQIALAERAIRPHIRRTPVVEVDGRDFGLPGVALVLKLELLQQAGSFKARGAFANLLLREVPAAGVVAASGGNHGVAVAHAARELGHEAHVYVPRISTPAKVERIRASGAELVLVGERYADALAASEEWAGRTGALRVHAFDQDETIMGAGTLGLELEQQAPGLDAVLVPVGGGGLIAGVAAGLAIDRESSAWSRRPRRRSRGPWRRAGRWTRKQGASPPIRSRPAAWASGYFPSRSGT
jgi:threonine dehydratase